MELRAPNQDDPITLTDRHLTIEESICDPADLIEVTARSVANREEAEREFPVLQNAIEEYFEQNGEYPETLDQLQLDQDVRTLSDPGTELSRHNYSYSLRPTTGQPTCRYRLGVSFVSPEVAELSLRGDRCSDS